MKAQVDIRNRKAQFEYELLEEYIAGMQLLGTEIKSIRQGKASIAEGFCQIRGGALYVVNMYVAEYERGTHANHSPRRERKLLLKKSELRRLERKLKESSLTIVPRKLFINNRGYAKLQIFLARGKKIYDKRQAIRRKDMELEHRRVLKYR